MNRRTLLSTLLAAPMIAVAARLGMDEKPSTVVTFNNTEYLLGPDNELIRIRVLGHYTMADQPWRVPYTTITRAEIERDYP